MIRRSRFFVVLAAALLAPHAFATTAVWGGEAAPAPGENPDDAYDPARHGPDPMLCMMLIMATVLLLIAVAAAVVLILVAVLLLLFFLALGALWLGVCAAGVSTAVGFLKGRTSTAFRVLFIQLGALAGIACGVAVLWLADRLVHLGLTSTWIVLLGGTAGLAGGVAAALLFNWAWTRVLDWMGKRYGPKPGGKASA